MDHTHCEHSPLPATLCHALKNQTKGMEPWGKAPVLSRGTCHGTHVASSQQRRPVTTKGCPTGQHAWSVEHCRKCIVRRVGASYKASGPDASGAYDASYSVVQGVVQHQHRTTQYDIVRPPSPSRRVNDGSGPSWGKGAFGPLPKYWHFASTTCRQCLQLAGRVYLWCTVSTDPRPPSPCAECCLIEGGGQSVA